MDSYAKNDTSVLTTCLARLGWSPERLAREINRVCGPGTISVKAPYNWLKGARPRGQLPDVVARILSKELGEPLTAEAIWAARPASHQPTGTEPGGQAAQRPEPSPLAEREVITATVDWLVGTDPRPVTEEPAEELHPAVLGVLTARIAHLRQLDDSHGGELVLDWALHELRWAESLLVQLSSGRPIDPRLHRAIAELRQLVGWVAADLGRERLGQSYLLSALDAARTAGDRGLAAHIISCMSDQARWQGRGEEALRLARIARKGSVGEPIGIAHALLATRQALAHATIGDEEGCRLALDEARELAGSVQPGHNPSWTYWVNSAVLTADAGRAWLELGRYEQAEHCLEYGLELFDEAQPRTRVLHYISLAEARLALRDVDGAALAANAAVDLAGPITSMRVRQRLTELSGRFGDIDGAAARRIVRRTERVLGAAVPAPADPPEAADRPLALCPYPSPAAP
ncbi:hypothetical protein [Streptomyces silvisoli]|uniref:Tetratricopeptide repeat protein n=1 Tax=Streptomyces silvisoli TaxID=3034235 RepID=A0ABT5ZL11_9ACTN|nr:hypothetical protein [Streptomyces silvisoli]MDF3290508.1 hypothetical protein [Streptomyces silvisoli]